MWLLHDDDFPTLLEPKTPLPPFADKVAAFCEAVRAASATRSAEEFENVFREADELLGLAGQHEVGPTNDVLGFAAAILLDAAQDFHLAGRVLDRLQEKLDDVRCDEAITEELMQDGSSSRLVEQWRLEHARALEIREAKESVVEDAVDNEQKARELFEKAAQMFLSLNENHWNNASGEPKR